MLWLTVLCCDCYPIATNALILHLSLTLVLTLTLTLIKEYAMEVTQMACKVSGTYCLALSRKSLPTLGLVQ